MTKRSIIRLASYSICLVAVLAGFAIIGHNNSVAYKRQLEVSYQKSLFELSECLDSIETNLTKSAYATTPVMMTNLSEDLYSECNSAKNALSRLPIDQLNLNGAYKFLTQATDYATYLSSKIRTGEQISQKEYENLKAMLEYSKKYSNFIDEMVAKCYAGGKITDGEIKSKHDGSKISNMSLNFDEAEKTFTDYPVLLYDGPFADAVLNRDPEMTKAGKKMSKEECRAIAAKALSIKPDELKFESEEEGLIPSFDFTYNNTTVAVTKTGGYVAYIICADQIKAKTIDDKKAVSLGKDYLKKLGYDNMESTYFTTANNVCVINYAYTENGVIRYTDLIKVGISLADGKVYSLEAKGYLTNHRNRENYESKLSESEAAAHISSNVNILSSKMCLIPKPNGKEAYCYEFHCKSKASNQEVLIYINAETGEEENILLLLYSDNGTLTK